MIKVLQLSSEKNWRGGEQQIAYLLQASPDFGIDNHIACRKDSAFEAHCEERGLPYIALPFKNTADLQTAFKIAKYCKENNIAILHAHSSKSHSIGLLSHVLFGNKAKIILSRRVNFSIKNNFFTRWKYNHSAIKKIICISQTVQKLISPTIKQAHKLTTIYSGIDTNKFKQNINSDLLRREYNIPKGHYLIGNTSALEPEKDHLSFIKCAELLLQQRDDVHFFIIGKGKLRSELEDLVQARKLADRIHFTGFRKDIIAVLPSLDLFLMTSKEEGLGTSVLDAFTAHVPVVSTNAGGLGEMVETEVTGMLCQVGDAEGLAVSVNKILDNRDLRDKITAEAREKVKQFDYQITAQKTAAVYKKVLVVL